MTSVTLTFDLWPWSFSWTSPLSLVITPKNFVMIRWLEHSQKGVTERQTDIHTDGRTDRQADWTNHRTAWSQLKMAVDYRNPSAAHNRNNTINLQFTDSDTPDDKSWNSYAVHIISGVSANHIYKQQAMIVWSSSVEIDHANEMATSI